MTIKQSHSVESTIKSTTSKVKKRSKNAIELRCGECAAIYSASSPVTQSKIHLTLPEPPCLNQRMRVTNRGRGARGVYIIAKSKDFKDDVFWLWQESKQEMLHGSLEMQIEWFSASNRSDIDSRLKDVLDGLNKLAYHDDSQIKKLSIVRVVDKENPRMEVTVQTLHNI